YLIIKRLNNDIAPFREELAVGRLIEQRRPKRFDSPRMIATSHSKRHPPTGEDIGRSKILGQPQGMPHRGNVEAAANLNARGHVGQVHGHHQYIGNALVPLGLEVVFGHPEGGVAETVHELRHGLGLVKYCDQVLVRKPAIIDRYAAVAHVVHVDMASKQTIEFRNHARTSVGALSIGNGPIVVEAERLSNQKCPAQMTPWHLCGRLRTASLTGCSSTSMP